MTGWEAVLLGIIQGLTEFLPVSSSGHLVLGKAILGIHINGIAFEIVVHFGTLFAVVTVFKNDLIKIFNAFTSSLISKFKTNEVRNSNAVSPDGLHLLALLIIGTLPGAIFGYLFRSTFESFFTNPQFVSGALLITGIILFISKFAKEKSRQLNYSKSFMIGMVQVGAFFPGISRSGATISAGLLLGIQPIESARFSFLLAVPLILGVSLIKFFELLASPPSSELLVMLVIGFLTAYLSGLIAIKWLLGIIQQGRFDRFAYYCFGVGILGLIFSNI